MSTARFWRRMTNGFEGHSESVERGSAIMFWGLLLLTVLFGFFGLDRSPTIWIDEAAYLEPAWRLATTGSLRSYSQFDCGERPKRSRRSVSPSGPCGARGCCFTS